MSEVTQILDRVREGDAKAAEELLPLVYEELRRVAAHKMANEVPGQPLQPTALVHEAWLRLSGRDASRFNNRAHFFRAAALTMRRILLTHAERKRAQKRGGGQRGQAIEGDIDIATDAGGEPDHLDLLVLNDALTRLAGIDPQKAQVVELRFFGGCSIDETAEALDVSTATVEREWRFARAWLRTAMSADPGTGRGAADE